MIERTLICDQCGTVIAAAVTLNKLLREAQEQKLYVRVGRKDVCITCANGGNGALGRAAGERA